MLIDEEEGIMFNVRLFLRQDRWRACVIMIAGVEARKLTFYQLTLVDCVNFQFKVAKDYHANIMLSSRSQSSSVTYRKGYFTRFIQGLLMDRVE